METGRGQIKEIYFNDTPVFRGTGGYYIIGNCPGNSGDGPDNVISTLKDGVMSSTSRALSGNSVYDGRPGRRAAGRRLLWKSPSVPLRPDYVFASV